MYLVLTAMSSDSYKPMCSKSIKTHQKLCKFIIFMFNSFIVKRIITYHLLNVNFYSTEFSVKTVFLFPENPRFWSYPLPSSFWRQNRNQSTSWSNFKIYILCIYYILAYLVIKKTKVTSKFYYFWHNCII